MRRSSQGSERVAVNREEPGRVGFVRAVAFIVAHRTRTTDTPAFPVSGIARAKDLGTFALNQGIDRTVTSM